MSNTGDDCYFYYYSTCTKGKECPFRHCELALGTEIVCTLWREGLCSRANCKFRHMESRINRAHIPCYWENQPGGCRKPHCVFLHKKFHTASPSVEKNQGLILPVSTQNSPHQQVPSAVDTAPDSTKSFPSNEPTAAENLALKSPSVPVEPVVVRIINDEESDTESTTSTPAKNLASRISPLDRKLPKTLDFEEERDFGIKTLEQLRMEKIHRESEHFYKSIYDEPLLEIHDRGDQIDLVPDKKQRYATFTEVHHMGIHMKNVDRTQDAPPVKRKLSDTTSNVTCDSSSDDKLASNDLRDIIKKKRVEQTKSVHLEPKKRFISLKKSDALNDDTSSITITVGEEKIIESQVAKEKPAKELQEAEKLNKRSFDFKIKTLDEIRREKNKKTNSKTIEDEEMLPEAEEEPEQVHVTSLKSTVQAVTKPKLKRPAREIYQVKAGNLSPRKGAALKEMENEMLKLSPPRKKPLSCIQKVEDISKPPTSFEDKPKRDSYEIPNRRILRLNKKVRVENGHEEHNGSIISKAKSARSKRSSLKSIQSFIRPSVIPQLFPVESLNDELSSTNSHRPNDAAADDAPMDCEGVESPIAVSHQQTNGIPSANVDIEIVSNHTHQDDEFNVKLQNIALKVSMSSQDETTTRNSTTDDLDKLLFAEECDLNLDDLTNAAEKNDDILLEIDKLLGN